MAFNKGDVPPIVEPIREVDWMWFRGDRVEVLKGPDQGKQVHPSESFAWHNFSVHLSE
jgi:hypothetical protein